MNIIRQAIILKCDVINTTTNEIMKKQEVLVMEDTENNKVILNLTNGTDITRTFWKPIINNNGKLAKIKQELFRNSSIQFNM